MPGSMAQAKSSPLEQQIDSLSGLIDAAGALRNDVAALPTDDDTIGASSGAASAEQGRLLRILDGFTARWVRLWFSS